MQTTAATAAAAARLAARREEIENLVAERDLRFYDGNNLYRVLSNETAGEKIRRLSTPLVDEAAAAVLADAILAHVVPNADERGLLENIHVLRFCPRKAR